MIKNTGQRLVAAQDRLKALTDVVQVSALIVQSDATRRNTDTLREIAAILSQPQLFLRRRLGTILFAALFIAASFGGLMKAGEIAVGWIGTAMGWIGPATEWISTRLPW